MAEKGPCRIFHLSHFEVCSPTVDRGTTARGSDDGAQWQRGPFPQDIMLMGVRYRQALRSLYTFLSAVCDTTGHGGNPMAHHALHYRYNPLHQDIICSETAIATL